MLEVRDLHASYGDALILRGVSFSVSPGEVVCLMGRNGAGKTTTMKALMGLVAVHSGSVSLAGEDISKLPAHEVAKRRLAYVPQGRRLFGEMTVAENLEVGLLATNGKAERRDKVLTTFPRLRERLSQRAETLSGGEQQMLATGRAMCIDPTVMLLDEPTEGLQPSMIDQIQRVVVELRDQGVAIVLVEQRVDAALSLADRVVFIENGSTREEAPVASLRQDHTLLDRYVGV